MLVLIVSQFTKKKKLMILGMLVGVEIQEQDQAGQAPLHKLNRPNQWIDNPHRLT
jgi:hypothetical protein